ncbi:hypothetical protein MAR_013278 [Mya arenaria]|uniref:Uncharacterized protein n=1 Tax=Mya arenaria TaxID=6604 RepID=A0ABY7G2T5_MYAAR|nr:hypothetical protein MAR_013278 [Mya arenaria]
MADRRLRHVKSVTLRNLQYRSYWGKDVTQLQVYFTLHKNDKNKESFLEEHRHSHAQKDQYKYVPNMVVIGMFDKYFTPPQHQISEDFERELLPRDPAAMPKQSYTINTLSRIHTVLRAISQMQASVKRLHSSIEDRLLHSQEKTQKLSVREDLLLRVTQMKHELSWQMNSLQRQNDVLDNWRSTREEKSHDLKGKFHQLEEKRHDLDDQKKIFFQTSDSIEKAKLELRDTEIKGPNKRKETESSSASGGRNAAFHSAEEYLGHSVSNGTQRKSDEIEQKEDIPVLLTELSIQTEQNIPQGEDIFKPADDSFFRVRTTAFGNTDSTENSSCGSFSEQMNGAIKYDMNFSLSPSPGSVENNPTLIGSTDMMHAGSKDSLKSGDMLEHDITDIPIEKDADIQPELSAYNKHNSHTEER